MIKAKLLRWSGLTSASDYELQRFQREAKKCNEIEAMFWEAAHHRLARYGDLSAQYPVRGYELDFALINAAAGMKLAIEIDGHDFHKTALQRKNDYRRERVLKRYRWRFVRFTGSDVYLDVGDCVREVILIVRGNYGA